MVFYLYIGTDPTGWRVSQAGAAEAVTQELAQATGPVEFQVDYPFIGTLVLSVRNAGTVSVVPPGPTGSHPSGARMQRPLIRVPSGVKAGVDVAGDYTLAPGTDLGQLAQGIKGAMTNGTPLAVPVMSVGLGAGLVLSGASLAYAVLVPAA